ncbi:TIGR03013 family XrtA/PEP-CTERM system glycosyltransferase [Thalassotalea crassostreae]|uniref:TIGR03013 family XrtA/PEP-CTERM system glycosyltransferase n=1 Tax=Thalassotalea crassostreae TaxID=1763536 RepID=UPI0008382F45
MVKMLLCVDVAIFFSAFALAVSLTVSRELNVNFIGSSVLYIFVCQLSFLGVGLYKSKLRTKFWGIFRRILLAIAISLLVLNVLLQFTNNQLLTMQIIFDSCLYSFVLSIAVRLILIKFNVLGFAKRNVIVLGAGQRALIIENRMRREIDRQGFNLLGFIEMPGDLDAEIKSSHKVNIKGSLIDYVIKNQVHEIVVATDERRATLPVEELFACKLRGVQVSEILDFFERETGQIAVNLIYPSWVIYSQGFYSNNDLRNSLDWLFNAGLAVLLFIFTWPLMLLTVLAIKMEDGWSAPCFYWQERVGLNGKIFNIVKFRSMAVDAEKNGPKWATTNDDRVTTVGRIIRKYRIDELPQIYNVITSDMGFVGPRPERPEFVDRLNTIIPYYRERHNVKSGLTGWAQLKYPYGATDDDAVEKLKYDLYYIKHRSFLFDLLILIQTTEIVLFGKGR